VSRGHVVIWRVFKLFLSLAYHTLSVLIFQPGFYRSLLGGVGRPGATCCHSVKRRARVIGHVVVGHGAADRLGGLPDENGALGACCHNELLVRRDSDLFEIRRKRSKV